MNPESSYLIAALRHSIDPGNPLPDSTGVDWNALLRLASKHAVAPALYLALRDSDRPPAFLDDLQSTFEMSMRLSLWQSTELARLSRLLRQAGIQALALRGPLLSSYLHGDLCARSSSDLDLLVRRQDILGAIAVLTANGYHVATALHWNSKTACLRSREDEVSLTNACGRLTIDVHWRILPRYFASPFDRLDVWKSLQGVNVAGQQVPTLAPEHTLLLLCAHTAKHAFERLGWIYDIACFVKASPGLDWPAVFADAARTGSSRQLYLGLHIATDVFGVPVSAAIPADPIVVRLAKTVKRRLLTGDAEPTGTRDLIRFCLALFERPRHRLRYLLGHFLPTPAEYQLLKLPPALVFLYYPFRLCRLLSREAL